MSCRACRSASRAGVSARGTARLRPRSASTTTRSCAGSSASTTRRSTTCAPATSSANVPSAPDERAPCLSKAERSEERSSHGADRCTGRGTRHGGPMSDWGFATRLDDVSGQVAIAGVGEAEQTRASGRTTTEIAAQAVERALADAGLEPGEVDGIMRVPFGRDQFDQAAYHEHFGTSHPMWESDRGGGMVWAGTAPYEAAMALREGRARHIVNTFAVAWATQRGEMVGGPGEAHARELFKQNLEVPFGWFPQPVYFATIAR